MTFLKKIEQRARIGKIFARWHLGGTVFRRTICVFLLKLPECFRLFLFSWANHGYCIFKP